MVRRFGRIWADLPFRGDRGLKIPRRVYRPYWRELDPFVRVEGLGWRGHRLVITGCRVRASVDITKRRHASKIVILRPAGRRRLPIVIPARSLRHPDATKWSGQDRYSYDWAGFRCEISSRWFRAGRRWLTGQWDCYVLVRGRGVWRPTRLHTPVRGPAERPEFLEVAPRIRFGARWAGKRLQVAVTRTPAVLHGCDQTASELRVDVDLDRLAAGGQAGAGPGPAEGRRHRASPGHRAPDGRREGAGARRDTAAPARRAARASRPATPARNGTCTSRPAARSGCGWRSRPGRPSTSTRPATRRSRWSGPGTATR